MNHSKPYRHKSRYVPWQPSEGNEIDARKACNIFRLPALRKITEKDTYREKRETYIRFYR